jgi:hypothetical protein
LQSQNVREQTPSALVLRESRAPRDEQISSGFGGVNRSREFFCKIFAVPTLLLPRHLQPAQGNGNG